MTTVAPNDRTLLNDIGQRLDHLPVGRMHRKVVVAIGLGLFFEMYEIFLSSTISTTLKTKSMMYAEKREPGPASSNSRVT